MWNVTEIERITENRLIQDLGEVKGKERFALYLGARKKIVEDILPHIRAVQPNLTDHSPAHVKNVLDNANKLLGTTLNELTALEQYSQIISILFHDVGNIYDRTAHQHKVSEIYDYIRAGTDFDHDEKIIITHAARSHCGNGSDGTKDTLKDIGPSPSILGGQPVRLRDIAAVLRFADELAEGPQRTSAFMLKENRFDKQSKIYHEYANISKVYIDRFSGHISLTYDINIAIGNKSRLTIMEEKRLRKLLNHIYIRIVKLDQERRYTKHYCEWLSPFKTTRAALRFWINNCECDIAPQNIELTDLVIPTQIEKTVEQRYPNYKIDNILTKIRQTLARAPL